MKQFLHQSYNSHFFRPKPEVFLDNSGELLVVATPWASRQTAIQAIQNIKDFYFSAQTDRDKTSAFEYLPNLSPIGNALRVAVMQTNDHIFKEANQTEYMSGIELLIVSHFENEIHFAQLGAPSLFLLRKNSVMTPLGSYCDLNLSLSTQKYLGSPLPGQLLGLYPTSHFTLQSFTAQKEDRLLFLSRSLVPSSLYLERPEELLLGSIVDAATSENEIEPFWAGVVDLEH